MKPALRHMFTDVYEQLTPEAEQQMAQLRRLLDRYPAEYDVSQYEGGRDGL